ncbi:hypothetical protein [Lentzea jiangxiensis]|uniref:hypothetical protein n=1 Tax=Lentzea jiangxiensis TaxID=641025 RepID=UPI00115FBD87|nr:hypothetical protein [Lentzea jiangxiensis]
MRSAWPLTDAGDIGVARWGSSVARRDHRQKRTFPRHLLLGPWPPQRAERPPFCLADEVLDRIDEVLPPGTDLGAVDVAPVPDALTRPGPRRRPVEDRAAM